MALNATNRTYVELQATKVIQLESSLAKFSLPLDERRNYTQVYNKMSIDQLQKLAPSVSWLPLLKKLSGFDLKADEMINVKEPDFVRNMAELVNTTEPLVVADYLIWRVVFSSMSNLDRKWRNVYENFNRHFSGNEIHCERSNLVKKIFKKITNDKL